MKSVPTYTATIYVGFQEQYTPEIRNLEMGRAWLHEYVNKAGLCVTITPMEFVYTGKDIEGTTLKTSAREPGFAVGLINYPRFPSEPAKIREQALTIGKELLALYKQFKVSIVFPDETIMLEQEDV